jgi:hypothetical protein
MLPVLPVLPVTRIVMANSKKAIRVQVEAWALHASRRLISPKVTAFVNFVCDYFVDK